jgi:hypothetical protein
MCVTKLVAIIGNCVVESMHLSESKHTQRIRRGNVLPQMFCLLSLIGRVSKVTHAMSFARGESPQQHVAAVVLERLSK